MDVAVGILQTTHDFLLEVSVQEEIFGWPLGQGRRPRFHVVTIGLLRGHHPRGQTSSPFSTSSGPIRASHQREASGGRGRAMMDNPIQGRTHRAILGPPAWEAASSGHGGHWPGNKLKAHLLGGHFQQWLQAAACIPGTRGLCVW